MNRATCGKRPAPAPLYVHAGIEIADLGVSRIRLYSVVRGACLPSVGRVG
jgi:hypothetical protein